MNDKTKVSIERITPALTADPMRIGGKAASLVKMMQLGLNVPPAVVIPCNVMHAYQADPTGVGVELKQQLTSALMWIRQQMGRPCLFSVRSGAPVSMPGMMDTVLNIGLNKETEGTFLGLLGERGYWDSYRRLLQMFGTVVREIPSDFFEDAMAAIRKQRGVKTDAELPAADLQKVAKGWRVHSGLTHFDEIPVCHQILCAVEAVFKSWDCERAKTYRQLNGIPETYGTAVTIQAMVYGNRNNNSGSGVLFTRDPSTGDPTIMAEYLTNAQGEDVVSGSRTPEKLDLGLSVSMMDWPEWKKQLRTACHTLEEANCDMMDVEFTVENGTLYILQSRRGKRTPRAAVRIATDLLRSKMIAPQDLKAGYLTPKQVSDASGRSIVSHGSAKLIAKGLASGGGVQAGKVYFETQSAVTLGKSQPVILVRHETTPDDIAGMSASVGIVTETGGATSHAAVVSRAMNKACVVGIEGFKSKVELGQWIVVDGDRGEVWSDPHKTMKISDGGDELVIELARAIAGDKVNLITGEANPGEVVVLHDMMEDILGGEKTCPPIKAGAVFDMSMLTDMVPEEDMGLWYHFLPVLDEKIQAYCNGASFEDGAIVIAAAPLSKDFLKPGVKQVKHATVVADLMTGDPVIVDPDFVTKVFGSQEIYDKLAPAIGTVNVFAETVTPYRLIYDALA